MKMNEQLDLELTPDEQEGIYDLIILYCEFNQSWMNGEVEGIKESKFANQILDLVQHKSKTKTITFNRNQIVCINRALNEKKELWGSSYDIKGDETGEELGIVDQKGRLIGVLGQINEKIKAILK